MTSVRRGSERQQDSTRNSLTYDAHEEEEEEADRKYSRLIASWRRKVIAVVESREEMDA